MRRNRWRRIAATASWILTALTVAPVVARAQTTATPPPAGQPTPTTAAQTTLHEQARQEEELKRFLDAVTVSATLNPQSVKDTPSTVSVIDAETIDRRLIQNTADLIKFEPGVYIESNLTRVGLNGFNIRGIGGNRVLTLVDGVETSEQFDFGPFNMHQIPLDLDTLKSAEIVRSAGSSLYGSDALGGVVSLFTKDPADYLAGRLFHLGGKALYDGRASDTTGNIVIAGGRPRVQASLFASFASGHEVANQGSRESLDALRTAPNPQDRQSGQLLGKVVASFAPGHVLNVGAEVTDAEVETRAYSSRGRTVAGPTVTDVADITSDDTLARTRVSVDHRIDQIAGLQQLSWNAYVQTSDVDQVVDEVRTTTGVGPAVTLLRSGTMEYEQNGFGVAAQGRKLLTPRQQALLFTFGGAYKRNTFDMLRDRTDVNAASGAVVPNTGLILPTKYFPKSDVAESGAYVQAELRAGRLTLIPGVRYDRFTMNADDQDRIFLESLSPVPADFEADAVSSRIGAAIRVTNAITVQAQYAGGFRAPPYSAINSGFTNLAGGYTSLPNPDLREETSDNIELGVRAAVGRASVGVTGFVNFYDGFIDQVQLGINPVTRLLEFQNQNVDEVRISGVELRGELGLTDTVRIRGAYARIRGDNTSGATDVPLNSVAPDQGAIGLEYAPRSRRWGGEAMLRAATSPSRSRITADAFRPPAYGVLDLVGWTAIGRVTVRGGVLNVTDATYYEWSNVRGRFATDTTIDRYSNPGVTGIVSLSYGW